MFAVLHYITFIFAVLLLQKMTTLHCGTGYFMYIKNYRETANDTVSVFSQKNCFHNNSLIDFNLPETTIRSVERSICPTAAGFRNSKLQVCSDRDLNLDLSSVM